MMKMASRATETKPLAVSWHLVDTVIAPLASLLQRAPVSPVLACKFPHRCIHATIVYVVCSHGGLLQAMEHLFP